MQSIILARSHVSQRPLGDPHCKNLSQCHLFNTDLTLGLTWDGTRTSVKKTNFSLKGG